MKKKKFEFILKDDKKDVFIRSTRNSKTSTQILLDVFNNKGLIGVYNLGLENMYDYLKQKIKRKMINYEKYFK